VEKHKRKLCNLLNPFSVKAGLLSRETGLQNYGFAVMTPRLRKAGVPVYRMTENHN
jgi:hypothetical protein